MQKKSVYAGSLIYRTIYVTLGVIATIDCMGWFRRDYNGDWYVFYTNLSNFVCIGVMLASIIASLRGKDNVLPRFRFYSLIMILVTFFVYNLLLADGQTLYSYFTDIDCALFHCILPIMYLADWIFFCKRKCLKAVDPLFSTIMPLAYVAFILVRALFIPPYADAVIYPYFFLDVNELGYGGLLCWVGALVMIFVALGYIMYLLDKLKLNKIK